MCSRFTASAMPRYSVGSITCFQLASSVDELSRRAGASGLDLGRCDRVPERVRIELVQRLAAGFAVRYIKYGIFGVVELGSFTSCAVLYASQFISQSPKSRLRAASTFGSLTAQIAGRLLQHHLAHVGRDRPAPSRCPARRTPRGSAAPADVGAAQPEALVAVLRWRHAHAVDVARRYARRSAQARRTSRSSRRTCRRNCGSRACVLMSPQPQPRTLGSRKVFSTIHS